MTKDSESLPTTDFCRLGQMGHLARPWRGTLAGMYPLWRSNAIAVRIAVHRSAAAIVSASAMPLAAVGMICRGTSPQAPTSTPELND